MKANVRSLKQIFKEVFETNSNNNESTVVEQTEPSRKVYSVTDVGGGWGSEHVVGYGVGSTPEEAIIDCLMRFEGMSGQKAEANVPYYSARPISKAAFKKEILALQKQLSALRDKITGLVEIYQEL